MHYIWHPHGDQLEIIASSLIDIQERRETTKKSTRRKKKKIKETRDSKNQKAQ